MDGGEEKKNLTGSFQIETRVKQTEGGGGVSNLDGFAEFPLKHGLGG